MIEYRQAARILLYQGPSLIVMQADGENFTHLVGGGIDEGETPLKTVLREVEEEIGYGIGVLRFMTILHHQWETAPVYETMFLYAGTLNADIGDKRPSAQEGWLKTCIVPWYRYREINLQPRVVYPWIGPLGGRSNG